MDLEHGDRRRWVREISSINQKKNTEAYSEKETQPTFN